MIRGRQRRRTEWWLVGGDGGILSGNPEELLRSALEKIVFFECRVEQLESELAAARSVAERARAQAAAARGREVELEHALAETRGVQGSATSQNAELVERVRLLEAERERLLSSMVERSRVSSAPRDAAGSADLAETDDGPDLAGFIAELRSEIERLRVWKTAAEAVGIRIDEGGSATLQELRARPHEDVPELATRFGETGRIGLSQQDAGQMGSLFGTRAERALYESSMHDLASADPATRRRAAGCLKALGSSAAAPIIAVALGRENDPQVKAELLAVLAELAGPGTADLVARELSDRSPIVRAAALEALSKLEGDAADPRLVAGLGDESPLVRRRATLLLGFRQTAAAEDALTSALADRDAGVARAAAVALSGKPSTGAQRALARALDHREAGVRRTAARAVSRWSDEPIDGAASAADRRSAARRIAEKLAALEPQTLRNAFATRAAPPRAKAAALAPERPLQVAREATPKARTALAVAHQPEPAVLQAVELAPLDEAIVAEIRAALRGRSATELVQLLSADEPTVAAALSALVARGALAQRGLRFFVS
jgi:hypothetical protein